MACLSKSKGWSPVAAYVYTLSWSDLQTTTEEADVEVFQPASARLILGMLLALFFFYEQHMISSKYQEYMKDRVGRHTDVLHLSLHVSAKSLKLAAF